MFKNIQTELCFEGPNLKRYSRKTSRKALMNTFTRGPPYTVYKKSKNIENEL